MKVELKMLKHGNTNNSTIHNNNQWRSKGGDGGGTFREGGGKASPSPKNLERGIHFVGKNVYGGENDAEGRGKTFEDGNKRIIVGAKDSAFQKKGSSKIVGIRIQKSPPPIIKKLTKIC